MHVPTFMRHDCHCIPVVIDTKIIHWLYATLYFVFAMDAQESDRVTLDLSVFVEALDKCFENVSKVDLIFHRNKVNINDILLLQAIKDQDHLHDSSLKSAVIGQEKSADSIREGMGAGGAKR